VDLVEEIVRELQVGLVDLVDEQHEALAGREGAPQGPELDVAADVLDVAVAEAGVVKALHRVVDVEAILGARRRLDGPVNELEPQRLGDGLGQQGLSGARLALDEEGALERQGAVDGRFERLVGQIGGRAGEPAEGGGHGENTDSTRPRAVSSTAWALSSRLRPRSGSPRGC